MKIHTPAAFKDPSIYNQGPDTVGLSKEQIGTPGSILMVESTVGGAASHLVTISPAEASDADWLIHLSPASCPTASAMISLNTMPGDLAPRALEKFAGGTTRATGPAGSLLSLPLRDGTTAHAIGETAPHYGWESDSGAPAGAAIFKSQGEEWVFAKHYDKCVTKDPAGSPFQSVLLTPWNYQSETNPTWQITAENPAPVPAAPVEPRRAEDLFSRDQFNSGRKNTALGVAGLATMVAALVTGLMPIILRHGRDVEDVPELELEGLPGPLEEPDYVAIGVAAGDAWVSSLDPDSTYVDDDGDLTDKGEAQLNAVKTAAEDEAKAEYAVAYAEWENECATITASNDQAIAHHEEQLAAHNAALARAEPQHVGPFAGVAAAAGVAGGLMTGVGFMKGHSISQNPSHPDATVTSTGQSTVDASKTSISTPSPFSGEGSV